MGVMQTAHSNISTHRGKVRGNVAGGEQEGEGERNQIGGGGAGQGRGAGCSFEVCLVRAVHHLVVDLFGYASCIA